MSFFQQLGRFSAKHLHDSSFDLFLRRTFGDTVAGAILYIIELAEVVVISLAIILPVRYFLVQPFYVKGASMEPNFNDHEYLIIDELSFRFRPPLRGEVIVFRYPADPSQYFIKRIIGLPGETVKIENGNVVIVNAEFPRGFKLDETYLDGIRTDHVGTNRLSVDQYFILGDNRPHSLDSRFFGAIGKEAIIGRVWFRGWPFDKFTVFKPQEYPQSKSAPLKK